MKNILYRGTIVHAKDAADGETPTAIVVTREANGYAIWRESLEEGCIVIKHELYGQASLFIEEAVSMVMRERQLVKKAA